MARPKPGWWWRIDKSHPEKNPVKVRICNVGDGRRRNTLVVRQHGKSNWVPVTGPRYELWESRDDAFRRLYNVAWDWNQQHRKLADHYYGVALDVDSRRREAK